MRSWLGVIVAAVLMAGGATAAAAAPASSASPAASPAAKAEALASRLVTEMTFPAGTKPAPLSSIPSALRNAGPPGGTAWAHYMRLLVAPVKPAAVWAVLLPHKPFDETGTLGIVGNNGPVGSSAIIRAPEPGVTAAEAAVTLEPWHNGTTLIAAYGYATWLPDRTSAEHLNPGSFRSVTVTASTVFPHQHTTTRTFTSAAVIGRLARFLNAQTAAPQLDLPCPFPATSYKATFSPARHGGPALTVTPFCGTIQVSVNGVAQPLLWDNSGGLESILGDLLRH
jgi:hypothetical protein